MPPVDQENSAASPWVAAEDRLVLLSIVGGGAESAESWLEARIVLLAAQGIPTDEVGEIAGVNRDSVVAVIDRFLREGVRG